LVKSLKNISNRFQLIFNQTLHYIPAAILFPVIE
jgi:hypothetical protein